MSEERKTLSDPWRSVTPTSFTDDDVAVWRNGKPYCAIHPHKCLVQTTIPALRGKCDGGTHVCPDCMRLQLYGLAMTDEDEQHEYARSLRHEMKLDVGLMEYDYIARLQERFPGTDKQALTEVWTSTKCEGDMIRADIAALHVLRNSGLRVWLADRLVYVAGYLNPQRPWQTSHPCGRCGEIDPCPKCGALDD